MMNEEKRDRMIRESLDSYLSGIDALPSQRAAISKSLVDKPPFFRRAVFRAVAVPAALTLLLCAGIGVFAGLQNHTAYPDHLKTDETLVAAQPEPTGFIALTAPEGEEGGTDTVIIGDDGVTWDQWGAVVPTVEPEPYASVRLVKFFSCWRDHNWQGMLKLCDSAWTEQTENPEKALEDLASFTTPNSFEIVSAVSVPGGDGPEYTMYCNLRAKDAGYRAEVRMAKGADGLWYVSPDSLKEYEVVPVEATRAGRQKNLTADQLRSASPDLWDKLVPLNLVRESSDIRLEIISAAMDEDEALILFSVQDLEEERAEFSVGTVMPPTVILNNGYEGNLTATRWYMDEGTEPNKIIIGEHIVYDKAIDPAELSDLFTLNLNSLELLQVREPDLVRLLQQYGEQTDDPIDPPMLVKTHSLTQTYTSDELRELGIKVLDPSRSLEVQLSDNIYLSGIKLDEDRLLHLQLRYKNEHVWYPQLMNSTNISWNDLVNPEDTRCLTWSGTYYEGDWLEYRIRLDSDLTEDSSLTLKLIDNVGFVRGDWSVEIPAEQIWFGKEIAADNIEAPAAETEEAQAPAEEPAEAVLREEPYANVRLVKFFRLWREQNWQGMLDMCTSGWKAQTEDPLKTLEGIAWIRGLEIVSMNPLPAAEPEYIMECIVRSKPDPDAWYRINVALEKGADGLWYVNPDSLRKTGTLSEEEIALRRSSSTGRTWYFAPDTTSTSSSDSGDSMGFLRSKNSRLVDDLVPVGLSCESDGIRLEIISAAIEEEGSLILYSLKDLTGDRVGRHKEYNPWLHVSEVVDYADGWTLSFLEQNAAAHYASYGLYIPGNSLYCAQGNLTFYLENDLLFYRSKETDLISYLRKYEDRNWVLSDLPENATLYPNSPEFETPAEGLGIKVLDSTDPLGIPLAENVTLEGIGYADDGMLHIQMHVVNNDLLTDSSGYEYRPIFSVNTWRPYADYSIPEESSLTSWIVGEDRSEIWVEYAYRYSRESIDKDGLKAGVYTADGYAHGPWEIEIQTDSVRK